MGIEEIARAALAREFGAPATKQPALDAGAGEGPKTIAIGARPRLDASSKHGSHSASSSASVARGGGSAAAPRLSPSEQAECAALARDLEWMNTGEGVRELFKRERSTAASMSTAIRVAAQRAGTGYDPKLPRMVAERDAEQSRAASRIFAARNEPLLDVLGGTVPPQVFAGNPSESLSRPGERSDSAEVESLAASAETVRITRAAGMDALPVDMHGLLPKEAGHVLMWLLDTIRAAMSAGGAATTRRGSGEVKWLACVVGTGHHSELGKEGGSLAPAVRGCLESRGEAFCEPRAVDGKRGGALMVRL